MLNKIGHTASCRSLTTAGVEHRLHSILWSAARGEQRILFNLISKKEAK